MSCRPSDGLALAVRTGTPIYVSDAVIAEVGFVDGAEPGTDDQLEEMAEEFKEFLDTISPEDFETERAEHRRIFAWTAKIRGVVADPRSVPYDPFRHTDVISSVRFAGVDSPAG